MRESVFTGAKSPSGVSLPAAPDHEDTDARHRGQPLASPGEQGVVLVLALAREPRCPWRTLGNGAPQARGTNMVAHDARTQVVPRRQHELLLEAVPAVD